MTPPRTPRSFDEKRRTLVQAERDAEADWAPPGSTRWRTLKGARLDVDQSAEWTGPHTRSR
jgi:hypothetical protein